MNDSDDQRTKLDAAVVLAERELRAFSAAVSRLYGEDEARLAADDWLGHLFITLSSAHAPGTNFRQITVAAAVELGLRLSPSAARTAFTLK
jgi:hypothetical protein